MANPADIVLSNAHIITMDACNSVVPAIAIGNGRVLAVGEGAAMAPHLGPQTRHVDMRRRTIVPGLPPAVDQVLMQALAKDPAQRFQTAGGLARALRSALGRP